MTKFAKLFEFEPIGQVLIVQDQTDPKISVQVKPECLGLCAAETVYKDFEACDRVFNDIDEEAAKALAESLLESLKELGNA